jgi:hypothetical protein
MNPIICMCCGEPISEKGAASYANPNVCVFCTSLLDGIDLGGFAEDAHSNAEQKISDPRKQAKAA